MEKDPLLLLETIEKDMRNKLSTKRWQHTLGVSEMAQRLALLYGIIPEKAKIAALLHDLAKGWSHKSLMAQSKELGLEIDEIMLKEPELLHAPLAALWVKKHYEIQDIEILNAIRYHTTGRPDMSKLEKIIYLSDYIEEGRNYKGLEGIRLAAFTCLDQGVLMAMDAVIDHLKKQRHTIHPLTIKARNQLAMKKINEEELDG